MCGMAPSPAPPAREPLIATAFFGALSRPWHLAFCAAGIVACNLAWGVVQERVGATDYCDAVGEHCERFRGGIPVMGLMQAAAASAVGFAAIGLFGGGEKKSKPAPAEGAAGAGVAFSDFFETSLCHTIASPVGYFAMSFIPFPLYMLVSSCKLIPVMAVGMLVNGAQRPASDYLSAAIMTQGVLLYSAHQIMGGGGDDKGHGAKGHVHAGAPASTLFGLELDETSRLAAGVLLTLVNLTLEGYTNASQDRLFKRGKERGRPVEGIVMMASMNAWSVLLLTAGLLAQLAGAAALGVRGERLEGASFLYSAGAFASRHPEVVLHVASFSLLGAFAQLFIFTCIGVHGSFTNTVITISRKFVTVLISVVLYHHKLDFVQWIGVLDVFAGLGIQLAFGGGGHGAAHAPEAAAGAAAAAAAAAAAGAGSAAAPEAGAALGPASAKRGAGRGASGAAAGGAGGTGAELYSVSPSSALRGLEIVGGDGGGGSASDVALRKRNV